MYFRFLYFIGDKVDTKTPTFCLLCPRKESSWVGLDLKLLIALTSFLSSLSLLSVVSFVSSLRSHPQSSQLSQKFLSP